MSLPVYGILLASFSRHSHQRNFISAFRANPRVRIVAVADEPDIDAALRAVNKKWANELNVPYVEGIDEALNLSGVDIVSIAHEIERRADIAVRAAMAGKHLWIDKFMGRSLAECDRVVKTVAQAGVASIVPSYVYSEFVLDTRRILRSGAIGELLGLHIDVMFGKGMPHPIPNAPVSFPMTPPGRWKYAELKREVLTVGAYAVGLIQCCLGRIHEVYGQGGAYFFPEHAINRVDDFGTLTLTDTTGRTATVAAGRIGVASHPAGGPQDGFLFGTKGTLYIDGKRPRIDAFLRPRILNAGYLPPPDDPMQWASGAPTTGIPLTADPNIRALDDLVDALDRGAQPSYTVQETRDHMEILLAGYHSMVKGCPVSLPLHEEVIP
ncbi:MAG: Gfo/Idh/MocA family oxidoreductase, partial [candidate division Zixibacteria bacterium]|nr:Gfo/Idh/MocA family oxidoreductase [candidate division Zixibacteria bacterium]